MCYVAIWCLVHRVISWVRRLCPSVSGACVARLRSRSLRSRRRPILGTPGAVSSSEPSLLYQPTTHVRPCACGRLLSRPIICGICVRVGWWLARAWQCCRAGTILSRAEVDTCFGWSARALSLPLTVTSLDGVWSCCCLHSDEVTADEPSALDGSSKQPTTSHRSSRCSQQPEPMASGARVR